MAASGESRFFEKSCYQKKLQLKAKARKNLTIFVAKYEQNGGGMMAVVAVVTPGNYHLSNNHQAICVGDPTVTHDWVTVMIGPITDIVPIPTGPAYACQPEQCDGRGNQ
ncbi:hypothetical protein GVN16_15935 [Emticicia sp. CRIBPO]|uniref:hypothetical protein n=1 Tax=Emticicia sp. CRIBPO TaxID=2683258 RepID=UPI0014124F61|nr:hypothetical protein [Emticicia sp. CRIBPO]NBA87264.1 hypothetical protein [Emticicia sp. CRIBPO]